MPHPSVPIPGAGVTTVRITAWALMLAPVLQLASTVAFVTDGGGVNDGFVGGTVGVWACLAFVVGFAGVFRALEPHAARAAPILMGVTLIGCAAGVGFNIDAALAEAFGRDVVDTATEEQGFVLAAYLPWGWCFPIGLVGTGVLLWRSRIVPRAAAALVVAGGVLFISARPARIDPLAVAGDALLVLGLVPLGWSMLTTARSGRDTTGDVVLTPAAGTPI